MEFLDNQIRHLCKKQFPCSNTDGIFELRFPISKHQTTFKWINNDNSVHLTSIKETKVMDRTMESGAHSTIKNVILGPLK